MTGNWFKMGCLGFVLYMLGLAGIVLACGAMLKGMGG